MTPPAPRTPPPAPPLTLAVILCTRNRADDLAACLNSLAAQTRPADEIIVVDASEQAADSRQQIAGSREQDPPRPATRNPHPASPSPLTRLHTTPGLPAQRNLGLTHTQADVVAFFDDDVVLEPDYLAELMALYERRWADGIGGACGSTPGWRQSSDGAGWLKRLFGITHVRASGERVRLLPSLGMVWVAQPAREIPCAALPGHCMSFRRAALAGIRFDERLAGYADGEDIDVTIQVGRRYPLWQTPTARLEHRKSQSERATLRRRFYTRTRNEKYLHRKLMPQDARHRLAWAWASVGRLVIAAMVGARQRTRAPVQGVWAGLTASANPDDWGK